MPTDAKEVKVYCIRAVGAQFRWRGGKEKADQDVHVYTVHDCSILFRAGTS
jgi:hypothetical protein